MSSAEIWKKAAEEEEEVTDQVDQSEAIWAQLVTLLIRGGEEKSNHYPFQFRWFASSTGEMAGL